jgi:hypothetical protein
MRYLLIIASGIGNRVLEKTLNLEPASHIGRTIKIGLIEPIAHRGIEGCWLLQL